MTDDNLMASPEEYLDPGYDATTAPGDNLLNDFCRAEIAAWEGWARAAGGRHGHDATLGTAWADTGCASLFGNPAHWSRPLDPADAAVAVSVLRDAYAAGSGGGYLLYSAYPTPDLRALGLHPVGHPPLMVRPAGPGPGDTPHDPGRDPRRDLGQQLSIVEVADTTTLHDFERTLAEAYPVPEVVPWTAGCLVPEALLATPGWHLYVGYHDGAAVATAAAFASDRVVDVTLVSSRPETRGRGFGAAITWAATLADPSKPAMLIASDLGRSTYARMGYLAVMRFTLWVGRRDEPGTR